MKQKQGQLWVIEGTDGAGKATQAKLLVDRLNRTDALHGDNANLFTFPNYKVNPFGPLLRSYLNGDFGSADDVSPHFASLLYALDRWQEGPKMKSILKHGDWIVVDRYTTSNLVYQPLRFRSGKKRSAFMKWVLDLEYKRFELPKPSGVILLSIPPKVSITRTKARRAISSTNVGKIGKADIFEQDEQFIHAVYSHYRSLAKMQKWHIVECLDGDRELTREEISDIVWEIISKKLT